MSQVTKNKYNTNCEKSFVYEKTQKVGCMNKKIFSPLSRTFFYDECDGCENWEQDEERMRDREELDYLQADY